MRRRISHIVIALSVQGALAPTASHATTFVEVSTEAIAQAADRVVAGTVLATESRWVGGRIMTRVAMREAGPLPAIVWFELPGGTVGDVTMEVLGMPTFAPGERALVLLGKRRDQLRLIGLAQGKLAIEQIAGRDVVALRRGPHGERVEVLALADARRELAAALTPAVTP